jgi:hypothetical protein
MYIISKMDDGQPYPFIVHEWWLLPGHLPEGLAAPSLYWQGATSLWLARTLIPAGKHRLPDTDDHDERIVEVWM